jgi:hypothetical protein
VILRPQPAGARDPSPAPVWELIEQTQRAPSEVELVPQASHAVLAGVLAQNFSPDAVPPLDDAAIQGIALHDIGWTLLDYEILLGKRPPLSFLDETPNHFVRAWTASIDAATDSAPVAGLLVSRHFSRLAEFRQAEQRDTPDAAKTMAAFLAAESKRQEDLSAKTARSVDEIEALVDVLQFCDVVSLFLCCGAARAAFLPELHGRRYAVARQDGAYVFTPTLLAQPVEGWFPAHRLVIGQPFAERRDISFRLG